MEAMDTLVTALRATDDDTEIERIKAELTALCRGAQGADGRSYLEGVARGEVLEVQWELEEVLEVTTPKKAAPPKPPEPEPEPEDPNRPLSAKDLDKVYDDPRGLILHRTKDGKRWFATQADPRTGQPQTFELHPSEIDQLQSQLQGSPYWVIGGAPVT